jgi:uncharacterized protein YceK
MKKFILAAIVLFSLNSLAMAGGGTIHTPIPNSSGSHVTRTGGKTQQAKKHQKRHHKKIKKGQ